MPPFQIMGALRPPHARTAPDLPSLWMTLDAGAVRRSEVPTSPFASWVPFRLPPLLYRQTADQSLISPGIRTAARGRKSVDVIARTLALGWDPK